MSVAGIFSTLGTSQANSYQLQNLQFQQLGKDLTSGNLSGAQSDFASLAQVFASPSAATTSTSNPVTQAFQQLSTDLKSGNLTAAQKDYATIQQDLQSQSTHPHHHNRMRPGGSVDQNQLQQDLTQLGQDLSSSNLSSGNLAAAQQAYSSLQQTIDSSPQSSVAQSSGTDSGSVFATSPSYSAPLSLVA
jgi:hypothetical protein